eukprot:2488486-Pyramimonas_sp.AAC.1
MAMSSARPLVSGPPPLRIVGVGAHGCVLIAKVGRRPPEPAPVREQAVARAAVEVAPQCLHCVRGPRLASLGRLLASTQ